MGNCTDGEGIGLAKIGEGLGEVATFNGNQEVVDLELVPQPESIQDTMWTYWLENPQW